jgi:hypothetical protein
MKKKPSTKQMRQELRQKGLDAFLKDSKIKERLYHATPANFKEFKPGGKDPTMSGKAIWMSMDPERQPAAHNIHNYFGKEPYKEGVHVMPLHVQAKNPMVLDDKTMIEWAREAFAGGSKEFPELLTPEWIDAVRKEGYDSIHFADPYDHGDPHEVIMFEPHKIKSAIGNRGTYDTTKKDITKASGGEVSVDQMRHELVMKGHRLHPVRHEAKGGSAKEPKSTVKAYKLFRVHEKHPGKLFPLFVDANTPVEMGKWIDAKSGEMKGDKVKSKIGPLAYRPGWHAGDVPVATHIGEKSDPANMVDMPPDTRPHNHVWAEIEMPNDVDWQSVANERGMNAKGKLIARNAHITDQIPKGGHYRYKTNSNMTGNWLIGGSMKVNRILGDKEVERINKKAGVADLPRAQPFNKKAFGLASGGGVGGIAPEEWVAEEHVNHLISDGALKMSKGGSMAELMHHIREIEGKYGADRLQRALDEIPNLEHMFDYDALRQAFSGDNAKALMTMNPADFEKYATQLKGNQTTGAHTPSLEERIKGHKAHKTDLSTEDYVKYLQQINKFRDIPFLQIDKEEVGLPLTPFISGHEGRHRSRSMAGRGVDKSLVILHPRSELREPFPRRYRDEYIDALKKELEMTNNMVKPQQDKSNPRPAIKMPDIYASGGDVHPMGINVKTDKKAGLRYADLIVDGHKKFESRNGDTLRPYVGKRVAIVRTGEGPAKAIGEVTVGDPMVVNRRQFRSMERHHLVPEGSAFDIQTETKHLYPMHNPVRYEKERDVGHGIVARKVIHKQTGGGIPPATRLALDALRAQAQARAQLMDQYNKDTAGMYTHQMPSFQQWLAQRQQTN